MLQIGRDPGGTRAQRGRLAAAGVVLGLASAVVWPAPPAGAATTTFAYTGAQQTFVVPAGVTSLQVLAVGGAGGNGFGGGGGAGGRPAEVSGDVGVFPGQTLYVEVGGTGIGAEVFGSEAFNGGSFGGEGAGGGGGASDVRLESRPVPDTTASLFSRLIVAAGGGGGGAGKEGTTGGAGGMAGSAGGPASVGTGTGGTAGTEESGGIGCGGLCDGKLGSGTQGSVSAAGTKGGGGGGGLFGGGGGEENGKDESGGGGGGGGSSLAPPGGKTVAPSALAAQVQLTYTLSTTGPPKPPPPHIETAFTLLRPIVGLGNSITLVLDLPGSGSAKAVATASHEVFVKHDGKRVRKKVRFTYGTARATVTSSGALELVINPSAAGKKALRGRGRLPVAIAVEFAPAGLSPPPAASKHLTVTLTRR